MFRRFPRGFSLLALAGVAALFLSGCGGGSSTPGKDKDTPTKDKDTKDKDGKTDLGKPDFTLTSADFVKEFKTNAKDAHAKYKDKVIELTGVIASIGTNAGGEAVFLLEGPDPKGFDWTAVSFSEPRPWKKAAPGQKVKLKGKVHPDVSLAMLVYPQIVEVTGDEPPKLTADDLGQEYAKGIEAAEKKYDKKWIILSGQIEKINEKDGILFKTKEKTPQVFARFAPDQFKLVKDWKPGQNVTVIGQYLLNLGKDSVSLITSLPVDDPK